ncbi:hypothetical protein GLAREA_00454 [Glarea lozoyensis ATCC 20868]|uniref:Uncharacterized protein n=1 Tax=Glarea lozoyensis (strain ATCC 20868 / MF5171) TaxID=1116229 RepID=S3CWJ8_GLAL2|nr:uncharacterized protein GLAREA_00454 [Glarea lozoyensis ATCC 20868]EPE29294.1 hypothetical protein GLAREA_00454 [Glarea lozoyensis ATCC 20868]
MALQLRPTIGRHKTPRTPPAVRHNGYSQLLSPPQTSVISGSSQWNLARARLANTFSTPIKYEDEPTFFTSPQVAASPIKYEHEATFFTSPQFTCSFDTPIKDEDELTMFTPPQAANSFNTTIKYEDEATMFTPYHVASSFNTPTKHEDEPTMFTPPLLTRLSEFEEDSNGFVEGLSSEDESEDLPSTPGPISQSKPNRCSANSPTIKLRTSADIDDDNVSSEEDDQWTNLCQDLFGKDLPADDNPEHKVELQFKNEQIETEDVEMEDSVPMKKEEPTSVTLLVNQRNCNLIDAYTHSPSHFKNEPETSCVKKETIGDTQTEPCFSKSSAPVDLASVKTELLPALTIKDRIEADNRDIDAARIKAEKKSRGRSVLGRVGSMKVEEVRETVPSGLGISDARLPRDIENKECRRPSARPFRRSKYSWFTKVKSDQTTKPAVKHSVRQLPPLLGLGISNATSEKEESKDEAFTQKNFYCPESLGQGIKTEKIGVKVEKTVMDGDKFAGVMSVRTPPLCSTQSPDSSVSSVEGCGELKTAASPTLLPSSEKAVLKRAFGDSGLESDSELHTKRLCYRTKTVDHTTHDDFGESKALKFSSAQKDRGKIQARSSTPLVFLKQFGGNQVVFGGKKKACKSSESIPVSPEITSRGWTAVSSRDTSSSVDSKKRARDLTSISNDHEVDLYDIELILPTRFKESSSKRRRTSIAEDFNSASASKGKKLTTSNLEFNNNITPRLFSEYMETTPAKAYKYHNNVLGPCNPRLLALNAACDAFQAKMRVPPKSPTPDAASEVSSDTLCLGDGEGGSTWEGCKDSDEERKWGFDALWGSDEETDQGGYVESSEGEGGLRVESPTPGLQNSTVQEAALAFAF